MDEFTNAIEVAEVTETDCCDITVANENIDDANLIEGSESEGANIGATLAVSAIIGAASYGVYKLAKDKVVPKIKNSVAKHKEKRQQKKIEKLQKAVSEIEENSEPITNEEEAE